MAKTKVIGRAYASDTERLDWMLWQISRGMNLMFIRSRRDIDELIAEDDAAGLSVFWAKHGKAPSSEQGASLGPFDSTVTQDTDANREGSNAPSHRAPVDPNIHPISPEMTPRDDTKG